MTSTSVGETHQNNHEPLNKKHTLNTTNTHPTRGGRPKITWVGQSMEHVDRLAYGGTSPAFLLEKPWSSLRNYENKWKKCSNNLQVDINSEPWFTYKNWTQQQPDNIWVTRMNRTEKVQFLHTFEELLILDVLLFSDVYHNKNICVHITILCRQALAKRIRSFTSGVNSNLGNGFYDFNIWTRWMCK